MKNNRTNRKANSRLDFAVWNNNMSKSKRSQVTIFIIVAILIVASIVGYFLLRDRLKVGMSKELAPAYDYFLSCIEDETKLAASLAGSQAGYLELPEFEAGSEYMPFSSQLKFLDKGVPYWYYVSGNNIVKEQIPSKEKIEEQMKDYLTQRIKECDFRDFEARGFSIAIEEPEVDVAIKEYEIEVNVEMPLTISFDNATARQTNHKVNVNSRLGKFYDIAKKIYDKENQDLFLENYGIDILRLYAPVDGTELTCSPKIWQPKDIREDLITALEANVPAIKIKGNYYSDSDKYFVQDIGENVDASVNLLYSRNWPTKIEIYPDDDPLMAEPVGLQEGLGILGFCYVPYHFVYDVAYPVLIQIYDSEEMFQFPIAVVIDKNKPRQALDTESQVQVVPQLCQHKLTEMNVYTYDTKLEPVESQIKFKCFDTSCYIGSTNISGNEAVLTAMFPQCVNGFVIASAEGYKTRKYIASTVKPDNIEIILDKKYKLELEVTKDWKKLGGEYAILSFIKDDETISAVYPEQKEIELTEGEYNIEVYVYSNSTITLEGSSTEKCIDVPKSGLFGLFGSSEEKCFTMQIPDQVVSFAVSGGGTQDYYMTESELENKKLKINAKNFGIPTKVEELQTNYNNVKINTLEVEFE